jgi:hypothetical protein
MVRRPGTTCPTVQYHYDTPRREWTSRAAQIYTTFRVSFLAGPRTSGINSSICLTVSRCPTVSRASDPCPPHASRSSAPLTSHAPACLRLLSRISGRRDPSVAGHASTLHTVRGWRHQQFRSRRLKKQVCEFLVRASKVPPGQTCPSAHTVILCTLLLTSSRIALNSAIARISGGARAASLCDQPICHLPLILVSRGSPARFSQ